MTVEEQTRCRLAHQVYRAVAVAVESFELEDMVGPDLAYLLGSILMGTFCEWPAKRTILGILRASFDVDHEVWKYAWTSDGD
jgi:hypothetical protein